MSRTAVRAQVATYLSGAGVTFLNTVNTIFPDTPPATVNKMVSGIDVVMYKPDSELIRLARLAIENGVGR